MPERDPDEQEFYTVRLRLRLYPNIQDFVISADEIESDVRDAVDHLFYPEDILELTVTKEEK